MRQQNRSTLQQIAHGFTLIEVMVVVAIIAIGATLLVPKLVGNDKRQFKLAVEQVSDLLTMYAQRQNLGQKAVGILHDRNSNSIELLVLDGDEDPLTHSASWRSDPYVQPVQLPQFMSDSDIYFSVDGENVDASEFPLTCEIGQERPNIQITMRGAGEVATITLPTYGVAPMLTSSYLNVGAEREPYDLDEAGRNREDW